MNQVADEFAKKQAQEAKRAADEKNHEGSEKGEEDLSSSSIEVIENRKSTAKTPGDIDEPMRVSLTRKYIEAVQAL